MRTPLTSGPLFSTMRIMKVMVRDQGAVCAVPGALRESEYLQDAYRWPGESNGHGSTMRRCLIIEEYLTRRTYLYIYIFYADAMLDYQRAIKHGWKNQRKTMGKWDCMGFTLR